MKDQYSCTICVNLPLSMGLPPSPLPMRHNDALWLNLLESLSTSVFHGDIMLEILARLPVKFLFRFRCVSKTWSHVTKHKKFCAMHCNYNKKISILFDLLHDDRTLPLFPVTPSQPILPEPRFTIFEDIFSEQRVIQTPLNSCAPDIIGVINGLVCLTLYDSYVILWNPATQEHYQVPNPSNLPEDVVRVTWGFGLDPRNKSDYKVVRVIHPMEEKPYVEIYSYMKNAWTTYPHPLDYYRFGLKRSIILDGIPYWRAEELVPGTDYYRDVIVSFTTCCDTFKTIELLKVELNSWQLGTFGHSLAILLAGNKQIEIFSLGDIGWSMVFSMSTAMVHDVQQVQCLSNAVLIGTRSENFLAFRGRFDEITYPHHYDRLLVFKEVFEYSESLLHPRYFSDLDPSSNCLRCNQSGYCSSHKRTIEKLDASETANTAHARSCFGSLTNGYLPSYNSESES